MNAKKNTGTIQSFCLAALLTLGAQEQALAEGTGATDAAGAVPTRLTGSASVQGGISPSIFVNPAVPPSSATAQHVHQFAGGEQYKPGQPAPLPPKPEPKPAKPQPPSPPAPKPEPLKEKPKRPTRPFTMTPRNGLMTWQPGIKPVVHLDLPKPEEKEKAKSLLSGVVLSKGPFPPSRPIPALRVQPLALQRPEVLQANRKETWEDWFQRVSHAIYQQWADKEVRPGMAEVYVTVWKSHDIDCQVVEFYPEKDLARDGGGDAAFCQAAIQSVYALRKCEVLGFPYTSQQDRVSFNMTFKREVGGPVGCFISPATDVKAMAKTLR